MNRLEYLRNRLIRLGRRRLWLRRATAVCAVAIAVLTALAVIFALDWSFRHSDDLLQRSALLILGTAAVAWAAYRYGLPWLGKREDFLEMALLVERHAGIDSDLVAALQFESPEAAQWGSVQLEAAVIEQVSSRQKNLDVMGVLPWRPLARRLQVLAVAVVVWGLLAAIFPGHVRVFFNHVLLGTQRYPTQTQIVALTVNGKSIDLKSSAPAAVRVPYGRSVQFEVTVAGALPTNGKVELSGAGPGQAAVVTLEPVQGAERDNGTPFAGQYERLVQTVEYKLYVGDTWTNRCELDVIPAPIIEVEPEIVLPEYARTDEDEGVQRHPRGTNQFAVLEGSEVCLNVHSDRPLKSVVLTGVGDKPIALVRDSEESDESGELWRPETAGTPLASVVEPLRYAIQVTDADDADLERPVEGFVRIEPDKPPRVAAATKTRYILPNARPTIYYKAADDYAVQRIWMTWEVSGGQLPTGAGPAPKEEAVPAPAATAPVGPDRPATPEEIAAAIREGAVTPLKGDQTPVRKTEIVLFELADPADAEATVEGNQPFDIGPLNLKAGDTLKVTVHATDYRGKREGKTARGEPVVFNVTDEQGVMHSLQEDDQKSARQIESIINNLLGIGGAQ